MSATPQLQLETLFVFDSRGRIVSTREPQPTPGPAFILIHGASSVAWAVHAAVPDAAAATLDTLARQEPAGLGPEPPLHVQRYQSLLPGRVVSGPAFEFPEAGDADPNVAEVHDEAVLQRYFGGWVPGEIDAGRSPVVAVYAEGHPVSICFCARRSDSAAEAGVETAPDYRGWGYAARVTAEWTEAVRASGRVPLYSTEWTNTALLAIARKLGLRVYAVDWSIEQ